VNEAIAGLKSSFSFKIPDHKSGKVTIFYLFLFELPEEHPVQLRFCGICSGNDTVITQNDVWWK
jgi:hypothetical protein